jgi:C4-dicarboxylate transporter/malic acid transport protein
MTELLDPTPTSLVTGPAPRRRSRPGGLLRDLERPGELIANVTPNWFASVMGTGIIAVAATSLPVRFAGRETAARVVWLAAAGLLLTFTVLTALHWVHHPGRARAHLRDPVMAPFYGAPPMAAMTVGAGTLLLAPPLLGARFALGLSAALWLLGTVGGLITSVLVPYLMFTRHEIGPDAAFGGWLMPVVPPMVSASTGALLLPHVAAGQLRLSLLLACYAMFGISLIASLVIITLIWQRLTLHKIGPARMVPTLWIVLGPLGQSVTAANLLGANAHLALRAPYATTAQALGVLYGIPTLGFAALWATLALAITVRTARQQLPFSLTWWSFTFPVGTCVTGTSALAAHTAAIPLRVAAVLSYLALVSAWAIVARRTAKGSWLGTLFAAPGRAA